ncbi:hypothetical protein EMPG_13479 [Blastomyces silverae]|uniref:Uncharacterized protein n=1 Tax=Blastomyces silverae TaxID=2060906 RepID=A0A0H1BIQ2_9EURO|nr:hypothetical protein EMPG_13479 [Blastomyces silverae]
MSRNDPTSNLSELVKRQLAFVLYSSNVTVDSDVCYPEGQKLSPSLFSTGWTWTRSCTRHKKLNDDLCKFIFVLIKSELSKWAEKYANRPGSSAETAQNPLDSSKFAKEYDKTGAKCYACGVARVAQNGIALKHLTKFLEARHFKARSRLNNPPRLLFWAKAFLEFHKKPKDMNHPLQRSKSTAHSHGRPRPSPEAVPERKLKTDWTEMTRATIKKWQGLEASGTAPTNETYSGHDLDCYTPAIITRSRTVGRMEHNLQRSRRARQQLSRNPLADKSTSNTTDHYHTLGRSHSLSLSLSHRRSDESDYLIKNDPMSPGGEPLSRGYNQQGNHPCPDAEDPKSRRYSVASLSSNYSLSPPATPVMEQPTSRGNRYNDALFSPAASETRTATAAGIAAVSNTCAGAGAGHYGSNGNFDTDLESVPGLEHDTDARYEREHGRSDATKVAHQWEQDSPQTSGTGDSDSEWDDDLVDESDEGHCHPGDEHRDGDGRANNGFGYGISDPGLWDLDPTRSGDDDSYSHGYGYNVVNQGPWDLDSKGLTPVEQPGGLAPPPRHAASSVSALAAWNGLLEDRGEEWNHAAAAMSRRR